MNNTTIFSDKILLHIILPMFEILNINQVEISHYYTLSYRASHVRTCCFFKESIATIYFPNLLVSIIIFSFMTSWSHLHFMNIYFWICVIICGGKFFKLNFVFFLMQSLVLMVVLGESVSEEDSIPITFFSSLMPTSQQPFPFSIFFDSVSDNHRNSCIMQTRVIANIYNRTVFVDALLIFFSIYLVKNSNFSHVTSGYFSYIFLWYYIIICYKKNIPLESPSTSIF